MLRRLHPHQPPSFAFTPANLAWAKGQMKKYLEGLQSGATDETATIVIREAIR